MSVIRSDKTPTAADVFKKTRRRLLLCLEIMKNSSKLRKYTAARSKRVATGEALTAVPLRWRGEMIGGGSLRTPIVARTGSAVGSPLFA
jgi:hypothetical protein